jgi:hypothetical protein
VYISNAMVNTEGETINFQKCFQAAWFQNMATPQGQQSLSTQATHSFL